MTRQEYYVRYRETRLASAKKYRRTHPEVIVRLRHKYQKQSRELMNKFKNKPCFDCQGWFAPCQMEFDRRPGEIKEFEIGNRYNSNPTRLYREMKKCDLICSNCHRLRTWKRSLGIN
jgi:hypothetical protein